MDIIFVLPGIPGSATGGSKVIFEYCNWLAKEGHNVEIDYFHEKRYESWLANCLWKTNLFYKSKFVEPKWFDLDKKIKTKVVYKSSDINGEGKIVIATAIETDAIVQQASAAKKAYFIQDFENWNCSDEEIYASYNAGMTNVVVAKWLKEVVDKHSSTPSYLVSNCINTNIFYDKGGKRRKHSIVFHYRSADYKGPQYALDSIRKLEEKYDDLVVDVISIEDKPENLPKSCVYHQKITPDEVAEINNRTEVFMCTSIEEGFGLPGLEAMACGCAVVSSSYRGALEYAVDGENSLLSPVGDVKTIVENIVMLFEDDNLRRKISEYGVETGKNRSLEKSAKEFERILMEEVEK